MLNCSDSRNSQGSNNFVCTGEDGAILPSSGVTIACFDQDVGNELASLMPLFANELVVTGSNGSALPMGIICNVTNSTGELLQEVSLKTTGSVDLFLKDTYGVFQVEACQVGTITKNCRQPIVYDFFVTNDGTNNVTITEARLELELTSINIARDLLSVVTSGGGQTQTNRPDFVDVCLDGFVTAQLNVDVETTDGTTTCSDSDELGFGFEVPCRIDVTITSCRNQVNAECNGGIRPAACVQSFFFDVELRNIGTNTIQLTRFDLLVNGERSGDDLLSNVTNMLASGETNGTTTSTMLQLCGTGPTATIEIEVEAEPLNGVPSLRCQAKDTFNISISPTPSPSTQMTPAPSTPMTPPPLTSMTPPPVSR